MLYILSKQTYNHPLSMNLYNLNKSKENIRRAGVAVIFESEKATMQYCSYYGAENDITVAVCGSSISAYHIKLLRACGAREVIVAFDRQFKEIGDREFQQLKNKLVHLHDKYGSLITLSVIFDKHMITGYKASPVDEGPEKFERLLRERMIP